MDGWVQVHPLIEIFPHHCPTSLSLYNEKNPRGKGGGLDALSTYIMSFSKKKHYELTDRWTDGHTPSYRDMRTHLKMI